MDDIAQDPDSPTALTKASFAQIALDAYRKRVGGDDGATLVQDLLTDLMHWCDLHAAEIHEDVYDEVAENLDGQDTLHDLFQSASDDYYAEV